MNENNRTLKQTAKLLLKDYPDILKVDDLKKIFPKIGKNKIYKLLQTKEIYSKRAFSWRGKTVLLRNLDIIYHE